MKDWQGWLALAVFAGACVVIGVNRYLMKSFNLTVIAMLVVAAALVFLLNSQKEGGGEKVVEMEDEV